jgi:hypothetical protein
VVILSGVVNAGGSAASKSKGDQHWTFGFTFAAWRIPGGQIQTTSLRLHRKVTDAELAGFSGKITPYAILRIQADVVTGLLESVVDYAVLDDQELQGYVLQLQKPVVRNDPIFGELILDRRSDFYASEIAWCGASIKLRLEPEAHGDLTGALKTAHSLWEDQTGWHQKIQEYAAAKLLPLKNRLWLDDDEADLTADEFLQKMSLESITACAEGRFEFWHSDGELFWGHSIQINGTLADGPTRADIPG